ncbi:MAG: hypothetical protein KDN05_12760, partial [Verrucomicrobiae bacterium]|nr:hypothetical protein [Verrucomicrobiae bacterium]
ETNPYIKRMADGVALFLASPENPIRKNTPELNVFSDFNYARSTAEQMDTLLWLFAHPDSPRQHDPEVLRRLLRRTHAYLDAINVHGPALSAGQLASFYDDFAIAPASIVFREFQSLYPGLIPANTNAEWDSAMTIAADNLWAAFRNRNASWVNTDVAIAVELFNFGRKTGRQELLDKAQYFIDDVLTSGRMFEDGAVGYIGTQNEAGGYQGTVASYVNRYYQMTEHPQALEILQKMEWYGPINGPMIDWWTSPSWKHAWNFISGSGQTGESTNGKNPYVRADMDASINAPASVSNWTGHQGSVAWYERGTTPLSRPDYTTFDRNIMGPRSWQGLWNYTGTLRAINDSESGHHTLMGCQIMETSPSFRVNASMMGIFPRIRVSSGPSRDTNGSFFEERHAWLTSKLTGDSTVTPSFSSLAASYKPHVFGSSTKGTEHNWTARQIWLNLPDRVIGLLDLAPNANLTAFEVQGAIRLGHGGTAYSSSKTIAATGAESWDYGDLSVKLHGHNYAAVTPEVYAFRSPNAPFTEITLRDQTDGATNTTARTYTAGSRWNFIAEIRPKATTSDVTVTEVADAPGLVGIEVQGPATDNRYRVLYNPGPGAVIHTPALDWGGPVRIHRSGTRFRPDWLPAPSGELPVETLTSGQPITIQPTAHVVLERIPPPDVGASILSPASETVTLSSTTQGLDLSASVTQTGGGPPVIAWSQLDGPGTVVFSNTGSLETRATFPQPGVYRLCVTATVDPSVATAERKVIVQPPADLTFRQGENDYQHTATFIRNDGTGNANAIWNSGARNQILVGFNSTGAMRSLFSYDLSSLPAAFPVQSARLDLWTSPEAGAGTVGSLTLHALDATPTEGSGSSTSDRNSGSGTGVTWIRRTDATENVNWLGPGGDFSGTTLSSVPGYAANITTEELKSFEGNADFLTTIESARATNTPLNLLLQSSNTSGTNFTRFHSDDSSTMEKRPLLTLGFSNNLLPSVDPGSAPDATVAEPAALTGTATGADTLSWQLVSGPGNASFSDSTSATPTVTFDRSGSYLLRFSATNPHGTVSAELVVEASHATAFAAWQELHWPGITDPDIIGPNADPDGDGLSNLAEFNAGTDPTDPQSGGPSIWT